MCSVLPAATAIKVKSRDQAHRRAMIKESRWCSGHKYDQNKKNARRCIYHAHTINSDAPSSNSSNFNCTLSGSTDIMVNY